MCGCTGLAVSAHPHPLCLLATAARTPCTETFLGDHPCMLVATKAAMGLE
ncbi:Putative sulfate transporter [Frankliniella fusca]|uniref:Sulfate transporter n=1 Tax=Frankliniella fusca TaxID=407009 RepID=A0AAE1H6R4_9NEOP|nr:Putative sulfate transporter [Frankliniella fusca]